MATDPSTGVDPFDDLMNSLGDEPAEAIAEEVEETEASDEAEAVEEPAEEQAEESAAEEEGADEIELDGKTLTIPKGTPPELVNAIKSMQSELKADYTRKTQEAAQVRKMAEERAKVIQQQEQLLSTNFQKAVSYKQAADRVSQFEQLDWQALVDSDPQQATKLNLAYQQAQREAQKLYNELQQGAAQAQQLTAQERQRMLEEGNRELSRHIKGWGRDHASQVAGAMKDFGFNDDEISSVVDPRIVRAMYEAAQWRKLQAEKPKALQKVAAAPKVIKPGTTQRQNTNKEALDRLKKHGRVEDLMKFL